MELQAFDMTAAGLPLSVTFYPREAGQVRACADLPSDLAGVTVEVPADTPLLAIVQLIEAEVDHYRETLEVEYRMWVKGPRSAH